MIKVAIADDHMLFREGIRFLLEQMGTIELIFEASSGQELVDKLIVGIQALKESLVDAMGHVQFTGPLGFCHQKLLEAVELIDV